MALEDLLVRIGVDTAAFSSGLTKFNTDLNKSLREAEKSFGGITKAAQALTTVGAGRHRLEGKGNRGFLRISRRGLSEVRGQDWPRCNRDLVRLRLLEGRCVSAIRNDSLRDEQIKLEGQSFRFAESLKKQGLAVDSLTEEYKKGKIDINQYAEALVYTAQQFSPNLQGMRDSRVAAQQSSQAIQTQKEKLLELADSFQRGSSNANDFVSKASKILDLSRGTAVARGALRPR